MYMYCATQYHVHVLYVHEYMYIHVQQYMYYVHAMPRLYMYTPTSPTKLAKIGMRVKTLSAWRHKQILRV